ncbi:haloacid dehalogenase-like hydrolase domain-containing protein 3 [Argonauta hians]
MSLYKLVTFDVTNTLIRVLGTVGHQYSRVALEHGININMNDVNKAFKSSWKRMNQEYPNYGVSHGLTAEQWWKEVMKSSLLVGCNKEAFTPHILSKVCDELYLTFSSNRGWEVIPGTEEGLTLLKDKGMKLAVISNFDDRLPNILRDFGLKNYFNFVLYSSSEKFAKPDAVIFEKALKLGGTKPEETIHVGDDLTNDYLGAQNVGIKPIFFQNNLKTPLPDQVDPHSVISTLKDIIKFL